MSVKILTAILAMALSVCATFAAGCAKAADSADTEADNRPGKAQIDTTFAEQEELDMNIIDIEGNDRFVRITREALNFIAEKSPEHYRMVTTYMKKIKHTNRNSGMLVKENPPTFIVNDVDLEAPLCWYASDIVHDAWHSKLYHDYLAGHSYVPDSVYMGYEAEMKCLQVQKEFLIVADVDQRYLDWIDKTPETRWWE